MGAAFDFRRARASPEERLCIQLYIDKADQTHVNLTYRVAPAYYWNTVPLRTMLPKCTSLSKRRREKYESRERCC